MSAKRSTLGASLGQKFHNVRKVSIDHFDLRYAQNNQENYYLKPSVESELVTRMKKRLKSIENKLKIVQNHKFHGQKDPRPLIDKDLNITIEGDGIQNLSSIKGDTTTIPVNYREYLDQRVEQKNDLLLHDSKSETLELSSLNERDKGSNCPNNIFFQSCTDNTGLTESNIEPCNRNFNSLFHKF